MKLKEKENILSIENLCKRFKKMFTKGHLYSITKGHLPVVKLVGIMFFFYMQNMC